MKKFFIIIFLLFSFFIAKSQTISGYVFSATEKTPVEFANVLVLSLPDSVMVKGVVTYMDGQYTVQNIKPGKYFIKSSFIGYQTNGIAIEIPTDKAILTADTLFLIEKTNEIEGVVVKGDMIKARELVDRTVYELLPEIEKTSTNGYDVLKKIPSVQVDFNNNVTLNGKSNFIIQVDGKQRDKEFLARILPADIESVEVIHNPSGKYDGSIDGVINVILKKEARVGINGNFGAQVKPTGKPTLGAMGSIDYGREKITFYVSGYSFIQRLNNNTSDYQKISLTGTDSIIDITGNGNFSITASSINTGFDYYLNDKNNLSLNYSYKPFTMENNLANTGDIFLNQQLINHQQNGSEMLSESGESNISLFYRKKFKKPIQELTVESNYYFFNSNDNNNFNLFLFPADYADTTTNSRIEKTDNNRRYFSTKADYVHPIGVSIRVEAGYQIYVQGINYDFSSNNSAMNNNFTYTEIRNAGYASFFWNKKVISFQTTLRVENSQIDINKEIDSNYTTVLPSANLLYTFNPKQNIKFTYNRRINRPDIYSLNPFEKLNNNLTVSSGNPYLIPEYKDRLQLTYTLNIKKVNFSPYLYHEFYKNKIDNLTTQEELPSNGMMAMYSKPGNILTGYEQGIGLNATIAFFNINGSFYKGHFNEYSGPQSVITIQERDYLSFRLNSYVYSPLFKEKVNAFAFINYNGVNITAQTKTYSPLIWGLGAQRNIKNHTFGFFYLLPFSKELVFSKTITETTGIYSENINSFDASWFIQVMYSYKFNKGRSVKKTERKGEIESDTKGGGLGR